MDDEWVEATTSQRAAVVERLAKLAAATDSRDQERLQSFSPRTPTATTSTVTIPGP